MITEFETLMALGSLLSGSLCYYYFNRMVAQEVKLHRRRQAWLQGQYRQR